MSDVKRTNFTLRPANRPNQTNPPSRPTPKPRPPEKLARQRQGKKYQTPPAPGPPSAQPLNRSTAQPHLAVTTNYAHKINNITSPAPGKSTPMVYPSTRGDSQACPTKAEGRTMAKQCKESRPNPSGQPQEPCSHGPSRPVAAGTARWATSGPSPHSSNAAQPVSINRVTHRLQPRPATTAETRTVPACPIPSGETNTRRRPNTANTRLPNKPTAPQRTQIKALTTPMPERRAKSTSARPPGANVPNSAGVTPIAETNVN